MPGGAYFDGTQTVIPLDKVKPYEANPRDPGDTDYEKSGDFRVLVHSIEKVGVTSPVQVFWKDGAFQLIAGHRRVAAVKWLNEKRTQYWENKGKPGDGPDLIVVVPATIQKAPDSPYERHLAMWNAEETKAEWPESRKFSFFWATYKEAPPSVKNDTTELAKQLGMRQSTVKTYLELASIPELREAMSDPSELRLPRAGGHKALRAIYRLVIDLVESRPAVVKEVTEQAPDEKAKRLLATMLFNKYRVYRESSRLGVGPAVAIERTVPLIDPVHPAKVDDLELQVWLRDENILRKDVIERRATKPESGDDDGVEARSIVIKVKNLGLYERPGRMEEDKLQAYVDDLTAAADYLVEMSRTARTALINKRKV